MSPPWVVVRVLFVILNNSGRPHRGRGAAVIGEDSYPEEIRHLSALEPRIDISGQMGKRDMEK